MFDASIKKKDLLFSIKPKWVLKILQNKKTIEVRKTKCNISPKFRAFIYCTKDPTEWIWKCDINSFARGRCVNRPDLNLNGRIVCHCTVPVIDEYLWDATNNRYAIDDVTLAQTCLTQEELFAYGKGQTLYGYHLEYIMPYCSPVRIEEAYVNVDNKKVPLTRAPQSWGYIDGVGIT